MYYPKVGVCCLIIRDNKVLFGKRKGDHGGGTWAPPGGHLEFNEDPKDTAIREVLEETGLNVSSPKFVAMTNDILKRQTSIMLHCISFSNMVLVKQK
jgi:8-oxo-dGTP diphosphatase